MTNPDRHSRSGVLHFGQTQGGCSMMTIVAEKKFSMINIDALSKPAEILVERISDAVGGVFRPYQIRRVAKAEAEARIILTRGQIRSTELERRALHRFLNEEVVRQENIEKITAKAIPRLSEEAKPEEIQRDWLTDFFDKSRLISDEEMQDFWARILAGETNAPGSFSKRTVHAVAALDKSDATIFSQLCNFTVRIGDMDVPLVLDRDNIIYKNAGLKFARLKHLDAIGLISFDNTGYRIQEFPQPLVASYHDARITLTSSEGGVRDLNIGDCVFTKTGEELSRICGTQKVPNFAEHMIERWKAAGLVPSMN